MINLLYGLDGECGVVYDSELDFPGCADLLVLLLSMLASIALHCRQHLLGWLSYGLYLLSLQP